MATRTRISATIDPAVLDAARAAVAAGAAPNLSVWISNAMARQVEHEHRLAALDELIAAHEAVHGEITAEDIAEAEAWASERSVHVDARPPGKRRPNRRKPIEGAA